MWSKAKFLVILLCELNRFYRERCKLQSTSLFRSKHDVHPPTPPPSIIIICYKPQISHLHHMNLFLKVYIGNEFYGVFSATLLLSVSCLSFLHLSPHHHHTIKCVLVGTYHFYMTMRLHHQII